MSGPTDLGDRSRLSPISKSLAKFDHSMSGMNLMEMRKRPLVAIDQKYVQKFTVPHASQDGCQLAENQPIPRLTNLTLTEYCY